MSLSNVRPEFVECSTCRAKPGSPALCRECLERRELYSVVEDLRNGEFTIIDRLLCFVFPPAGYTGPPPKRKPLREMLRICPECEGMPNPECKEHGR